MDKLIIDNLEEFYVTVLDVNNARKTDLADAEEIYFQIRDRAGVILLQKTKTLGGITVNVPTTGDLQIMKAVANIIQRIISWRIVIGRWRLPLLVMLLQLLSFYFQVALVRSMIK